MTTATTTKVACGHFQLVFTQLCCRHIYEPLVHKVIQSYYLVTLFYSSHLLLAVRVRVCVTAELTVNKKKLAKGVMLMMC